MGVKLTKKQKRFCDEYLVDLNATRAYKAAGYSVRSDNAAAVNGHKLLRNTKIDSYLKQKMREREKRTEITQDRVLRELARIGFANVTDYANVVEETVEEERPVFNDDGEVVDHITVVRNIKRVDIEPTTDLDADRRAALSEIKETKQGIEIKLHDKVKALELLGRHLGMFTDNVNLTGIVGVQIIDNIPDDDGDDED